MNNSGTISGFITRTGAESLVFDVGRRVVEIPRRRFEDFERLQQAYPLPFQQGAWFGVLFWRPETREDPFIWFLRLPLDERALLIPAARDAFLHQLVEVAGTLMKQGAGATPRENTLAESPYTFRPREERLAVFHAKAACVLRQPASRYYEPARSYCAGEIGYQNWAGVGIQGLADIAARWDRDGNAVLLEQGLSHLPVEPFAGLCGCLENEPVGAGIAGALARRVDAELTATSPDTAVIAAGIRGISFSSAVDIRRRQLRTVLDSATGSHAEILAAISRRCWQDLTDDRLRPLFLEHLAENRQGQDYFNEIMADLLYLPGMREHFFKDFRDPERSERLSKAIGRLFSSYSRK